MKCFFSLEFRIINTPKILQESMMQESMMQESMMQESMMQESMMQESMMQESMMQEEEDYEFIAAEMEQYEKYYIYKGMLAKIQDSLADEMITKQSFDTKDRLNSMLELDFFAQTQTQTQNYKRGYTFTTETTLLRNIKMDNRRVSINLDSNKVRLNYITCITCGGYLEMDHQNLAYNILCNCEVEMHFTCRRGLDRVHEKIQYEYWLFEKIEEFQAEEQQEQEERERLVAQEADERRERRERRQAEKMDEKLQRRNRRNRQK